MFGFFKRLIIKRARVFIFEFHEGTIYSSDERVS